jgi:hypothetical protein
MTLQHMICEKVKDGISRMYADPLNGVQIVTPLNFESLADVRIEAIIPEFNPRAEGLLANWKTLECKLEIAAVCDNLKNDKRKNQYAAACDAVQGFVARDDLRAGLSDTDTGGVTVDVITPDEGSEEVTDGTRRFFYRLHLSIRGT